MSGYNVLTVEDLSASREAPADPIAIEIAELERRLSEETPAAWTKRIAELHAAQESAEQRAATDRREAAEAAVQADAEMRALMQSAEQALEPLVAAGNAALDYWPSYSDRWRRAHDLGGMVPMRVRASEAFPNVRALRALLDRYERLS
jgi:hypothetical protein